MANRNMLRSLIRYEAPTWMKCLTGVPEYRLQLGMLNTPIQLWYRDLNEGFLVDIKRDDMTGSTLSGNKVRKLEFLFADAVKGGCLHVVTCGGEQSNHCRAVAVLAAELKMKCHLFLRSKLTDPNKLPCSGNILLNRMSGSKMHLIPKQSKFLKDILPMMQELQQQIMNETSEMCYLIPVGGSDVVGLYGYIQAFDELVQQNVLENYDDIVLACGSGGSAAGLCIGNILTGSKLRLHAVCVCDNAVYFHQHINEMLQKVGLGTHRSEDNIDIIEGHKGDGYGLSTTEELELMMKVSSETGIMLDPVYTVKAVKGMFEEIRDRPERFKGKRLLFIHTGGVFGLYDGRINDLLKENLVTNHVDLWL